MAGSRCGCNRAVSGPPWWCPTTVLAFRSWTWSGSSNASTSRMPRGRGREPAWDWQSPDGLPRSMEAGSSPATIRRAAHALRSSCPSTESLSEVLFWVHRGLIAMGQDDSRAMQDPLVNESEQPAPGSHDYRSPQFSSHEYTTNDYRGIPEPPESPDSPKPAETVPSFPHRPA